MQHHQIWRKASRGKGFAQNLPDSATAKLQTFLMISANLGEEK
jgi:hypothetical protein